VFVIWFEGSSGLGLVGLPDVIVVLAGELFCQSGGSVDNEGLRGFGQTRSLLVVELELVQESTESIVERAYEDDEEHALSACVGGFRSRTDVMLKPSAPGSTTSEVSACTTSSRSPTDLDGASASSGL